MIKSSLGEEIFAQQLKALKIPFEREYRFCERKWRFDFAFPEKKIAVEVEGGIYSGGRHTRGYGFIADMEKYNTAAELGWRVFRFTPQQIKTGKPLEKIESFFYPKHKGIVKVSQEFVMEG